MAGPSSTAGQIEEALAERADPQRAEGEKRYLKSDLEFLGVPIGDIRTVTARALKDLAVERPLSHEDVVEVAAALWAAPLFERRMAATVVLERSHRLLDASDLPMLERLLRESGTWALVDVLAINLVGRLGPGKASGPILDRWSRDEDFWIRRASLLAELRPIKSGAALSAFFERADRMLDEKEFFIRKAIGWVLREASKTRPDEVFGWIAPRTHRASGVTMREAVKYLDADRRDLLMPAHREHRPAT
jgi:3-methyladenine DNA glycosylase AlkD